MRSFFVAGSRQISQIPAEVRSRLDTMIEKGFQILLGDANGADKALQRYLANKSYPNVLMHCMRDHCRNNIRNWPTRQLVAPRSFPRTFRHATTNWRNRCGGVLPSSPVRGGLVECGKTVRLGHCFAPF
jgi:hypothetical protein